MNRRTAEGADRGDGCGNARLNFEATLTDTADAIHTYPTVSEGSREAAMAALGLPLQTVHHTPAGDGRGARLAAQRADRCR
jgi:hypothetical protein